MSYIYQNLMGLKRLETRHITLQHIQNSGLNELKWIYGTIYKNQAESKGSGRNLIQNQGYETLFD